MRQPIFLFAAACVAFATLAAAPAHAEERTAGRSVSGDSLLYPSHMIKRPLFYDFTPMVSNHDPLNDHSEQWVGQDWDVSKWPANWTPEIALRKFYAARIFTGQDFANGARSVTLGPTFYTLSELDQGRTLKLLTDTAGVFSAVNAPVILRDHATKKPVGSYSPSGLQLF